MRTSGKFLSVLLSVVMVVTSLSVAFVSLVPTAYAAPTSADYDTLATRIRTLRTNTANPTNAKLSVSGSGSSLSASYDDYTGDMIAVAEQYYTVFNGLKPTGTINQNTTSNRTATMINDTIRTEMKKTSRFSGAEYDSWGIDALLNSLIANANVDSSTNKTSALTAPTITVKVNNKLGMLAYSSVSALPNSIVGSYTYSYPHSSAEYTSGSGCNATTKYYVKIGTPTRTTGDNISTAAVKTLNTKIAGYSAYYGYSFAELVNIDADTLSDVKNDLAGAYNAVASDVYAHFFSAYDTAALLEQIDAAIAIGAYIGIAQELQATTTVDISGYTYEQLSDLYFGMKAKLNSYNGAPASAREFLESEGYVDMDEVSAKFEEVENAYQRAYLRDVIVPRMNDDLATYETYDDDWTIATDGVEGIIAAAEVELGYIATEINAQKADNIEAVLGEGFSTAAAFAPVNERFARIREVNGYNLSFKQYQNAYNSVFAPLTLAEDDAQLLEILAAKDGWYTQLRTFAAELSAYDAVLAAKILTDAEAAMEEKIDRTYAALNAILETQIVDAWEVYQSIKALYGDEVEVDLNTYNTLKKSIGGVNVDAYDFLSASVNFTLSAEAVEKYEELKSVLLAIRAYDPAVYLTNYADHALPFEHIVRELTDKDRARDRDFEVKDEYYQNLIDDLDAILTNNGLADLGLDLDLNATLDGIFDKMYTDAFVNTLMGALYPMLSELVRDKLNELVGSYLGLMGDLDDAFAKLNVGLAPKKVGTYVDSRYPAIAQALKGVSGGFMDGDGEGDNCWTSAEARNEIWRVVVDDDGNPVLDDEDNPTYELIFDWGIDAAEGREAKKEAFLKAVDSALKGVQPLFMALLCNKAVPTTQVVSVLFGAATVSLGMMANDGYNNTLIPIFEAMGVTPSALYDAKTFTRVRDIFEFGLISPLEDLFSQIAADPLNKILEILPTLAFAIQNNLVLNLLHNLKVDLDVKGGGCAGSIIQNQLPPEGVSIDLGEQLNFADLLGIETFYEDVLSVDGVLALVMSLLAKDEEAEETEEPEEPVEPEEPAPELKLPHINGAKLAMMGTGVVWGDSYRSKSQIVKDGRANIHANIVANKPLIAQSLIDYLLNALSDEEFMTSLLYMLNKDKPEEEQVTALPDIVNTILASVNESRGDALAAIFELLNPVDPPYTMPDGITWITDGNLPSEEAYKDFWIRDNFELTGTLWDREDALYVKSHLKEIADIVIKLLGDKVGNAQTLEDAVAYLAGSIFTADNVNTIAGSLGGLLSGLELPEAIAEMGLFEQLGLDPAAWDEMSFEFEAGDKDAFKNALITVLDPLAPLLQFLLAEKNIELTLLNEITVTALGYDGYSYGIVPLLEALRCTGVKSTADFIADRDNIVANIIDPLFTAVDALLADPLGFIGDIIPSLIYFDMVDALSVVFDHVLFAADVLTETIRPIYELNIRDLLSSNLSFDLDTLAANPLQFVMTKVSGILSENAGIEIMIDYTEEIIRDKLHFTAPERFDSANGDDAYTINLSDDGKAELLVRLLDYVMAQLTAGENAGTLTGLVTDLIGSDAVSGVVGDILDNVVNNYPDSVVSVVKLLFPERQDIEPVKIDWITDNIAATGAYSSYWDAAWDDAPGTEWTKEKAAFIDSHLEEILGYVIKLLGDNIGGASDLEGAVAYLSDWLFTDENANTLVAKIKELVDGFGLSESVLDIFAAFGLDLTAWDSMSFEFEDGDRAAFKDAFITVLDPLAPVLRVLLVEGGDLSGTILDAIPLTLMGYDGYSWGLVPLLEALGCTGVKSTPEFAADSANVVRNIVDPLFTLVDQLESDPLGTLRRLIPALVYFDAVDGVQVGIQNLLLSVNVVLETARPLYDLDLEGLIAENVGVDLTDHDADPLQFLLDKIPELVGDSLMGLTLDMFSVNDITDKIHFTDPERFDSGNGEDGYSNALSDDGRYELLTFVLDYVVKGVVFKPENRAVINGLIDDAMGEGSSSGTVGQVLDNFDANYPESLFAVLGLIYPERVDMDAPKIEWITEANIGADFYSTYWSEIESAGDETLWTKDKAVYLADHLGNFLDDIALIFGDRLGGAESLDEAVDYLMGSLYTAATANKLVDTFKGLASGLGLPDAVIDIIKAFDVDLTSWDGLSYSFADGDKAAFKAAIIEILEPLAPVLRFILIEGGDLEGEVLDAIPVKLLGYDGYSYGLVPLLEALGCTGLKTTAEFKADKANVVKNIVDPVFSLLDTVQSDPLKFIETVIPGLIYFDKVGGVQVAVENLLFSVNRVLEIIRPLYDVDIYELVEENAGIDLHFAEEDPVDFLLVKIGELIEENTDIKLEVDFTVESLSERLHFTEPIKMTSANGDDRYTIRLSKEGKADLVTQVVDFAVDQVVFANNAANIDLLLKDVISNENTRALVTCLLNNLNHLDKSVQNFYGINDTALALVFWVFFGADSVTDATADYFFRYSTEDGFLTLMMQGFISSVDYLERFTFLSTEVLTVEYPALMDALEQSRSLLKDPRQYNDAELTYVSGILARLIVLFANLFKFIKSLFGA